MLPCKYCGRMLKFDILTGHWKSGIRELSQYCYVDFVTGSQLHEPIEAPIVTACRNWAKSSDAKFVVPDDRSVAFWLHSQLWVTMSMLDHFWLKKKMQAHHPEAGNYRPTHEEQILAAMEAEFEVCMSSSGMLQLRRSKKS